MNAVRFTLVTDGSSDAALKHPLRWLLINNGVARPIEGVWADLRPLPAATKFLADKIDAAFEYYPCELMFIHRDAEREPATFRREEIEHAVRKVFGNQTDQRPYVAVVPVRMTEAWFLFDEHHLREAAGNPKGMVPLDLPPLPKIEGLVNPKETLNQLFRTATELPAQRLKRFSCAQAFHRLAELIQDFAPLRQLPAFNYLEEDLRGVVENAGWRKPA
jgi:hypothetical protein